MSTKAELKENLLASKLEGVVTWTVHNKNTALTALGIVTGIFLISSVFFLKRKEIQATNLTRLSQAQSFLGQNQYEQASQILSELFTSAHNNDFKVLVSYHQGLTALGMKDFTKAAQYFQTTVESAGTSPLKPLALNNLAYAFEQQKNYEQAGTIYGQFMVNHGDHFLAPRVQLSLGRALAQSGKMEEAKKALQQLIDLYPTSSWAENARSFLDKNKTR